MSGCQTCGGFGMRHDPIAHNAESDCTCVPHPYGAGPEEDCPTHGREAEEGLGGASSCSWGGW